VGKNLKRRYFCMAKKKKELGLEETANNEKR